MILRICNVKILTFRTIRGFLLALCFVPFLTGPTTSQEFYQLAFRVCNWPQDARELFYTQLAAFPRLLSRALLIAQTNLTVAALSLVNDPGLNAEKRMDELATGPPKIIACFISDLRTAVLKSETLFDADEFVNEPLTALLTPESQLINAIADRSKWSYITTPAVLTLPFKSDLLRIFSIFNQRMQGRQEFEARGGNVTLRNLQLYLEVSRNDIVNDTLKILQHTDQSHLLKKLVLYMIPNELFREI
jgi:hypothetical protein